MAQAVKKRRKARSGKDTPGKKVYEENKKELEDNHWGEFVVIDEEKEKIVTVQPKMLDAMLEARKKDEEKTFYIRRIGDHIKWR